jgi:hypothetical protein
MSDAASMVFQSHRYLVFILSAFLSATIGLASGVFCYAGLQPYHAWAQEYHDGIFVLVMVPTDQQYREEWESMMDEPWDTGRENPVNLDDTKEAERLRSLYPVNGLYLNDGSSKLVWQFPPWTYGPPYLPVDGRFAVFSGRWSGDYENLSNPGWRADVADFVVDGTIVASYNIRDLLQFPRLKYYVTQQYLTCEREDFDPNALTYTVATHFGEEIVFDVTNGRIISHYRPVELLILVLAIVCTTSAAGFLLWRNRHRKQIVRQPISGD